MVYYSLILVAVLLIALIARHETVYSAKPFVKSATFLVRFTHRFTREHHLGLIINNVSTTNKTERNKAERNKTGQKDTRPTPRYLQILYPGQDIEKKATAYQIEKIRIVLLLVFSGSTLALMVGLSRQESSRINENGEIYRNSWEDGSLLLTLEAVSTVTEVAVTTEEVAAKEEVIAKEEVTATEEVIATEEVTATEEVMAMEDIMITIDPQNLTEAAAGDLAAEVFQQLPQTILRENISLSQITGALNLVSRLADYPFEIKWESSRPQIVRSTGEVHNEELSSDGEAVVLTAILIYQGNNREFYFPKEMSLTVYPVRQSDQEKWRNSLLQAVVEENIKSADQNYYRLPQTIEGRSIKWQEPPSNDSFYLWVLFLVAAGVVFYAKDDQLRKKVIKRSRQSEKDYPELVRKLTLYLGAGMTIKKTWKKMVSDYITERREGEYRVLYEEMLVSLHQLENGRSEQETYYRFGKRMGSNRYRKLMSLLCNHLRRGNSNLLMVLREEADRALEEQKNMARVSGEEMGTRLLLPMMLMLAVVVVIIMIPAFEMF